jgi:hypothetical protein
VAQTTLHVEGFGNVTLEHGPEVSLAELSIQARNEARRIQQEEAGRQERIAKLIKENPEEFDPGSDEFQEKFGPTTGFFGDLAAGAGKAIVDLGRGAKQLAVEGANLVPGADLDEQAAEIRAENTAVRERDDPLLRSGGGLAGFLGTNVLAAMFPGGLAARGLAGSGRLASAAAGLSNPRTLGSAAASGATFGALNPVGENESRLLNIGLGAGFGAASKAIAEPIVASLTRGQQAAKTILQKEGVPLGAAARSGSARLQSLDTLLDESFLTNNAQRAFKDKQFRAFTKAVLKRIGADADEATEDVMFAAEKRIGDIFDRAMGNTDLPLEGGLGQDLIRIFDNAQDNLGADALNAFQRRWQQVFASAVNGKIPGNAAKQLRSQFSRLSNNSQFGPQARQVAEAIMDTVKRINPSKGMLLKKGINQWRNLKIIQGAVGKGETRLINPRSLSNAITTKRNQNLSVFGKGGEEAKDLARLARAGREVLPSFKDFADTGRRSPLLTTAEILGATSLGAGAAAATGNDPFVGGALGFGAGVAAPSILQSTLTNQNFLDTIIQQGTKPGLLRPAAKQGLIQGSQLLQ